jgi:4-hydroxyproline epimerase
LLCEPSDPACIAGVIFFNNVGYLGMCGHGTIGLVVTLAYMGRIHPGVYKIETPAGTVSAQLHPNGAVTVHNVASYRYRAGVTVDVPGYGRVIGEVAWGGNWFFLVKEHKLKLSLDNLEQLTEFTWAVRKSLSDAGITGERGAEIDHVELFGPPDHKDADSKNFVLCPGKAYDRSPCGTGTSAKAACLYADGKLIPGQVWRQESIVGSVFEVSVALDGSKVMPTITGTAFVTAEGDLILHEKDPFRLGIDARAEPAALARH